MLSQQNKPVVHEVYWKCVDPLQVLKQLPAKEEKVEFCSMSEKQLVLYQSLFKKLRTSVNGESKPITAHLFSIDYKLPM